MEGIEAKTVAQCVSENIKAADVFKKRGIDFCCGGNKLVKEVCEKKKVSYDEIVAELRGLDAPKVMVNDFQNWDLDFLAAYIINKHHEYVRVNTPLILEYAAKVAKVHGHYYTEVVQIHELFQKISHELICHMQKEEMILFPYIKDLAKAKKNNLPFNAPPFMSVQNPISVMEREHVDAGDDFREIEQLSNDFTPPEGACNTFKALYAKLQDFQDDLHEHIHLENNILFPKAIELENELLAD